MGFCTRDRWSHKRVNHSSVKHAPALETKASLSGAPAATCRARTRGAWCGAVVYTAEVPGRCQVRVYAHSGPGAGMEPRCIPAAVPGHCQKVRRIPPAPGHTAALGSPTHHQSLPRTHLKAVPGSQVPMTDSANHTRGSSLAPRSEGAAAQSIQGYDGGQGALSSVGVTDLRRPEGRYIPLLQFRHQKSPLLMRAGVFLVAAMPTGDISWALFP